MASTNQPAIAHPIASYCPSPMLFVQGGVVQHFLMQNPAVGNLAHLYYILSCIRQSLGIVKYLVQNTQFQLRKVSRNNSCTCLDFLLCCPPLKQRFLGNPGKAIIVIINEWLLVILASSRALRH